MEKNSTCIWTGRRDARVKAITLKTLDRFSVPTEETFYVLPEYEQSLRKFNGRLVDWGRSFLKLIFGLILLMLISVLLALIFSVSNSMVLYAVGINTSLIGLVIVLFPFATPETVKWMGLKRAIIAVRTTGFLTIIFGIAFCFLPL